MTLADVHLGILAAISGGTLTAIVMVVWPWVPRRRAAAAPLVLGLIGGGPRAMADHTWPMLAEAGEPTSMDQEDAG